MSEMQGSLLKQGAHPGPWPTGVYTNDVIHCFARARALAYRAIYASSVAVRLSALSGARNRFFEAGRCALVGQCNTLARLSAVQAGALGDAEGAGHIIKQSAATSCRR